MEGNRRVAALKFLREQYEQHGEPLEQLDPELFDAVPVVVHDAENRVQHLINMGLVHVSGKRHWSQLAQSLSIKELVKNHGMDEDEVVSRLSISKHEVRLSMRALSLCDAYRESDWGDQFDTERYTLLREAVRNKVVKIWLEWNDGDYVSQNAGRQEQLFALISRIEDEMDASDDEESITVKREPALRTRDHVRRFGKLVETNDEQALRNLEASRDITAAEQSSEQLGRDRVRNAVALIGNQTNELFKYSVNVDDTHIAQLRHAVMKLAGLWVSTGNSVSDLQNAIMAAQPPVAGTILESSKPVRFPDVPRSFSNIVIKRYRGLEDMTLDGLRRINIFAGRNNAGKTSLLEVVRLLVSQDNPGALLDILRRRARLSELDMTWAVAQLPDRVEILAEAEGSISVTLQQSVEHALRTSHPGYLGSLIISANMGEGQQDSTANFYSGPPGHTVKRGGLHQLGPLVHSSPFSNQDPAVLAQLYDAAVEAGLDRQVAAVLGKHLDAGIDSIKLTSGAPPRFRVTRSETPPPDGMDLAMYGDGLQRMFHVGLLFAHARGGFVLIDELENGVHAGLLPHLVRMVHTLALEYDAQVFIATHSKECIDAFVAVEEIAADVRGYSLGVVDKKRIVDGVNGEELARLVELMDADLRTFR